MLKFLFVFLLLGTCFADNTVTLGTSTNAKYIVNSTDASATIQQALNDIDRMGGGTLMIEPGMYMMGKSIVVGNNTAIIGAGMDKTILKLVDKAKPWSDGKNMAAGFVRTILTHNFYMSDLTLDGNKKKQKTDELSLYGRYGIYTAGCVNATFDRVRVTNFQGYGFDPHGQDKKIYGVTLTITNCLADNNDWDGYTLDQSYYLMIVNNTARNNGRHGFNIVTGTKFTHLQDNFAYDNGYYYKGGRGCGIMIQNNMQFGTGNAVFNHNLLSNSSKAGICLNDVYNVTITNNAIEKTKVSFNVVSSKDIIINDTLFVANNNTMVLEKNKNLSLSNNNLVSAIPDTWYKNNNESPMPPPTPEPIPPPLPVPSPVPEPSPEPVPPQVPFPVPEPSPEPVPPQVPSPVPEPPSQPTSSSTSNSINFMVLFITLLVGRFISYM
jgi:Right handed beta helix region